MTVRECYMQMNGDYEEILKRFGKEERIEKYLGKFLKDVNFDSLRRALAEKNYVDAFVYVHNLKGVSSNLSMSPPADSSGLLCEELRSGEPSENHLVLFERVKRDYEQVITAITSLFDGRSV